METGCRRVKKNDFVEDDDALRAQKTGQETLDRRPWMRPSEPISSRTG